MPKLRFTPHLRRFIEGIPDSTVEVEGTTVRQVLDGLDQSYPRLLAYLLDDAGALRQHVNIFIDDAQVADRVGLTDPVPSGAELFIAQALSGG